MWTYHQRSGMLLHDNTLVGQGHSGSGPAFVEGRNNPDMEAEAGPIPRGQYQIGAPEAVAGVGDVVMRLTPVDHDAHGREDIMIHGDEQENSASSGSIILSKRLRQLVAESGDSNLEVEG